MVSGSMPGFVGMAKLWYPAWTTRQVKPEGPDVLDGVGWLDCS